MTINHHDPLPKHGPSAQRELFDRFSRAADGFSAQDTVGAAVNILLNALRQVHPTRVAAELAFDDMFGRSKALLVDHYDSLGRKRGLFPYHQTIEVEHFDARRSANGTRK